MPAKPDHETVTGPYKYVQLWGRYMHSDSSYIASQVKFATETNAPENAIYERDGVWRTADQVTNPSARYYLGLPALTGSEIHVLEDLGVRVDQANADWALLVFPDLSTLVRWTDRYETNYRSISILVAHNIKDPISVKVTF